MKRSLSLALLLVCARSTSAQEFKGYPRTAEFARQAGANITLCHLQRETYVSGTEVDSRMRANILESHKGTPEQYPVGWESKETKDRLQIYKGCQTDSKKDVSMLYKSSVDELKSKPGAIFKARRLFASFLSTIDKGDGNTDDFNKAKGELDAELH